MEQKDKNLYEFAFNREKHSVLMRDKFLEEDEKKFRHVYIAESLKKYSEFIERHLQATRLNHESEEKNIQFIYRGFSTILELRSNLRRELLWDREDELLMRFEREGSTKLGQFNNAIDFVAAAQHYGLYTRLIDWSYSPYIATLFALGSNHKCEKYSAIAIRSYNKSFVLRTLLRAENTNKSLSLIFCEMKEKLMGLIKVKDKIPRAYRYNLIKKTNKQWKKVLADIYCDINLKQVYNYFNTLVENFYYDLEGKKDLEDLKIRLTRKFLIDDIRIFLETNLSNERIKHQRGLFEIDMMNCKEVVPETDVLLIPTKLRQEIIGYIDRVGINYKALMEETQNQTFYINNEIRQLNTN